MASNYLGHWKIPAKVNLINLPLSLILQICALSWAVVKMELCLHRTESELGEGVNISRLFYFFFLSIVHIKWLAGIFWFSTRCQRSLLFSHKYSLPHVNVKVTVHLTSLALKADSGSVQGHSARQCIWLWCLYYLNKSWINFRIRDNILEYLGGFTWFNDFFCKISKFILLDNNQISSWNGKTQYAAIWHFQSHEQKTLAGFCYWPVFLRKIRKQNKQCDLYNFLKTSIYALIFLQNCDSIQACLNFSIRSTSEASSNEYLPVMVLKINIQVKNLMLLKQKLKENKKNLIFLYIFHIHIYNEINELKIFSGLWYCKIYHLEIKS